MSSDLIISPIPSPRTSGNIYPDYAAELAKERAEQEAWERQEREDEPWREGDPPSADSLGLDVTGLSPARERLVRFAAWLDATRAELASLETGRQRFLRQLGVPATTQAELDEFLNAERSGFMAWLRRGAEPDLKPQLREFQRQELDKRLGEATHAAEVARAALAQADEEIPRLERWIGILEKRHQAFVWDALIEEAGPVGADYMATIEKLRGVLTDLLGLAHVVGAHGGYREGWSDKYEADIDLLAFRLPTIAARLPVRVGGPRWPKIEISDAQSKKAAEKWRERMRALSADPRAQQQEA